MIEIFSPVYYYSPLLLLLVLQFVRIGLVFMVFSVGLIGFLDVVDR